MIVQKIFIGSDIQAEHAIVYMPFTAHSMLASRNTRALGPGERAQHARVDGHAVAAEVYACHIRNKVVVDVSQHEMVLRSSESRIPLLC